MRLKSKRLISLLLAGSMMVSMLPASAVTAFAETTAKNSVTSEAAQNMAVMVDSFTTGQLEEAVTAKHANLDEITSLTVRGGTLNKADFQFLSGVVVTGDDPASNSATAVYPGKKENSTDTITYLKNLTYLDLTGCSNTEIPARAFQGNTKLSCVILPDSLQRIERSAFSAMTGLTYVGTLAGKNAGKVEFPNGVTFIGQSAFWREWPLTTTTVLSGELVLPENLQSLGSNAFEHTKVSGNIKISATVEFPGPAVSEGAQAKESSAVFGHTQISSVTFEDGVTAIPANFVSDCPLTEIKLPAKLKTIGYQAFRHSDSNDTAIGTIVIPESVTFIGQSAFTRAGKADCVIVENPDITSEMFGAWAFNDMGTKIYLKKSIQNSTKNTVGAQETIWDNGDTVLVTEGGTIATDGNGDVTAELDTTTGLYTPTKEGYKFVGWYNGETELTGAAVAGKTYTAKWAELHTVTFDDADVEPVKVAHGEQLEKPADPKKDGYKFDYWCDANGDKVTFPLTITDDTTLTAKWTSYNTKVDADVKANADPASKTVEITVNVEAAPAELDGATATLNFTDANGNDDSANVVEVKVNGITVNKNADGSYTAKLNDLMNTGKVPDASENGADAVMLAGVNEEAVVPSTVKGTALLTVTYKTPGKHNVGIVLNAANGDVICKEIATVEIAPEPGTLNLTGCTAKLEDGTPVENGAKVPVGAEVTVTFEQDADSDLVLNGWNVTPETLTDTDGKLVKDITAETFTFKMPETDEGVTIAAKTKTKAAAPAEDDSLDAATVVTGVVLGTGTAILAYHIGTEVYAEQVLGKGVAIPRTREEVALKAWELAGKPAVELNGEPLSEAAQAEKWAVESGLMQNVDGSFNGSKKMSKLKALRTLDAAKKLG